MHDVELAGQSLKSGDRVLLCWVSGNLDETEFENPEEVDFDRTNKRHMAFGLGRHRCMGSDMVRLEFRIMFEQILSRMPDFRVDEAGLPSMCNAQVLAAISDPSWASELGQFNVEINVPPRELTGDAFTDPGDYSLDSGKWKAVPVVTFTVRFGVPPTPPP